MEQRSDIRIKFREWLIEQELDPETAYGILESVPPYDWSLIARRDEMNERFDRIDSMSGRLDGFVDQMAALNRTLAVGALTLAVTLVLGFASLGAGMLFTA